MDMKVFITLKLWMNHRLPKRHITLNRCATIIWDFISKHLETKKFPASTQESFDFMCYGILANILQNQYRNRVKKWTCWLELYLSGKMMIQQISNKKQKLELWLLKKMVSKWKQIISQMTLKRWMNSNVIHH